MMYLRSGTSDRVRSRSSGEVVVKQLAGNPYFVFGPRPFREQRTWAHIVQEHRAGRPIEAIMCDSYMRRHAGDSLAWKALVNPETIRALGEDACDAIRTAIASIRDAGGSSISDTAR
jgi:hypothetical protein